MTYSSLTQIQADIRTGKTSCADLVEHYLERIEKYNSQYNVFLEVYAEEARAKAIEVDTKIQNGTAGRLAGMVLGLKDVLAHKNHGLQASSKILNGFQSQFSATAVERVLAEDVIIIGRQNCDEFAMGSANENSAFGVTRNFADAERVPGGSSGASAVAVQADMCLASLGSDTGGSVRQPAAFCGVVGLKPTYSRVSRWGLIAYASSFDCIGPITKNVEDARILLEIIAGADEYDSTVSQLPVISHQSLERQQGNKATSTHQTSNIELGGNPHQTSKRFAYFKEGLETDGLDPEVKARTLEKIDWLRSEGHIVEAVDFPLIKHLLPTYYILTTAEASSNLSRFDGVRYGHRTEKSSDLEGLYKKSRAEGFGAEVKRRIMLGTFVLSADYYDAYYTKAQKVRRLIKNEVDKILEQYDCLISPTTPTPAFKIGEKSEDPIQQFLADLFTVQANVTGHPAISIPNGTSVSGLPIGIQLTGKYFSEHQLLNLATYLQRA